MKKVIVIGCPGSGKSYFSKILKVLVNIPLYHLDMIYHKKDGSQISKEEFDSILDNIMSKDEWILDGNYQRTLEKRLEKSDTVFLLDYSTDVCIKGANERIGTKRDDLPWVENELDKEFEQRIINFNNEKLPLIYKLLDKYNDKNIIIFKTREQSSDYLEKLKEGI